MDVEKAVATFLAFGLGLIILFLVLLIAWCVFYYMGVWKLYKKAGRPGWNAIVPFYNRYVLCEMVGLKWYWFLMSVSLYIVHIVLNGNGGTIILIADLAALIANINIYYNLSKKLNKDSSWVILLFLFGGVMLPLLGYGKDEWYANALVTPNGFFDSFGGNSGQQVQGSVPVQGVQPVQPEVAQQFAQGVQPVQPSEVQQTTSEPVQSVASKQEQSTVVDLPTNTNNNN